MSKVKERIALSRAQAIAEHVQIEIEHMMRFCEVVGSVRRRCPDVGDIEFVVLPINPHRFLKWCEEQGLSGGERIQKGTLCGHHVEFYIAPNTSSIGAMMLTYTGDAIWNFACRSKAKKRGMKLNQYGLFEGEQCIASKTESEILEAIDMRWHDPQDRSLKDRKGEEK